MSASSYSFVSWVRQGLGVNVTAADFDDHVKLRTSIRVALTVTGEGLEGAALQHAVDRTVPLYGPGDIVGVDPRAIVRTDPRDLVTTFEPNYVPCIEFYDEDFPWRYTPAAPDGERLRPWIMLVVLADGEFREGTNTKGRTLPYVVVENASAIFPPATQLWAWAHAHANRRLTVADGQVVSRDDEAAQTAAALKSTLDANADLACSRIVCPRKLAENSGYIALLVPVFETGRLSGLGLDPKAAPNATFSAWADYPAGARQEPDHYPYYYRWYFRTGGVGDFEYLVRLLKPTPVDARVGYRDLDVLAPGSNLPPIDDPGLGGVLRLGGALRAPRSSLTPEQRAVAQRYEGWMGTPPHPFQSALARFVNLADAYTVSDAPAANAAASLGTDVQRSPDPLITPPIYGRWLGQSSRLLTARNGQRLTNRNEWVHDLNLDPAHRTAAGFGTRVVQDNQESYMEAAWAQVGAVLDANRRMRLGQVAREVTQVWYRRDLGALATAQPERALALLAPMHRRIVVSGLTVHAQVERSPVPRAALSAPVRRAMRPRGRIARSLPAVDWWPPHTLLDRLNRGEVTAAPPKVAPAGAATTGGLADRLEDGRVPHVVATALRRAPWLALLLVLVLVLLAILAAVLTGPLSLIAGALAVGIAGLLVQIVRWRRVVAAADVVRGESATPGLAQSLPASPDFRLTNPGDGFVPRTGGGADSTEAVRFKTALADWLELRASAREAGREPVRQPLDLPAITTQALQRVQPDVTVPRFVLQGIDIPRRMRDQIGDDFREVMAYPEIDIPMYEPLTARSPEAFLPNIHLIEENSITLLESNQRFIEAYMVGVNHEFARELLWREFPTDQQGTCFAQFWNVSGYLDMEGLSREELRRKLRDIPPIHLWPRASRLGEHDNRQQGGVAREEVVLAVRGELLKKYPTAVVYAQRAAWQRVNGQIDRQLPRVAVALTASEEENGPPPEKVRLPLYEAKVSPDIYFFGFSLTVPEARGEDDDPGWFFVIQERPGEPRFGLDLARDGALNVWNDLSWEDAAPGLAAGQYLEIDDDTAAIPLIEPGATTPKHLQWAEDRSVGWNRDTTAAELAYILYQAPVRVMVHAAEMLRPGG